MFFGYFLSMNELQATHFDPGIFFVKIWSLELHQEISYKIVICYPICEGGGVWTFMAGHFCGRSGLPQLGVVLVFSFFSFFYNTQRTKRNLHGDKVCKNISCTRLHGGNIPFCVLIRVLKGVNKVDFLHKKALPRRLLYR